MDLHIAKTRPWEHTLPALLEGGLMRVPRPSHCRSKFETCVNNFNNLINSFAMDVRRLHITHYNRKVGDHQRPLFISYCACLGDPLLKRPEEQVKERTKWPTLDLRATDQHLTRSI